MYRSYRDHFLVHIKNQKEELLHLVTADIANDAQRLVHIDTGALRGTITGEVSDGVGRVSAGGPELPDRRAIYEELGTYVREPHPYLRPAALRRRSYG